MLASSSKSVCSSEDFGRMCRIALVLSRVASCSLVAASVPKGWSDPTTRRVARSTVTKRALPIGTLPPVWGLHQVTALV